MLISIPDSALYPDSGFQSDSGLSQGGILTVVFIPTVVYILTVVYSLSDYSSQHSPHSLSYFHVIFISAYPAVRVKFYAYVNMLGRNDLITTNLLFATGAASLQLCEGKKPTQEQRE